MFKYLELLNLIICLLSRGVDIFDVDNYYFINFIYFEIWMKAYKIIFTC